MRRTAEEAEANAAAAVRSRMSCLNRELFETGERNVALAAERGQVKAELGRPAAGKLAALASNS